jgi:hypothetical protein
VAPKPEKELNGLTFGAVIPEEDGIAVLVEVVPKLKVGAAVDVAP